MNKEHNIVRRYGKVFLLKRYEFILRSGRMKENEVNIGMCPETREIDILLMKG